MACFLAATGPRLRDTWNKGEQMGLEKVYGKDPTRRFDERRGALDI
jgi:hypothetical protein